LTDDRAFGADDVAGAAYAGHRFRKLRFLMTDNIYIEFGRMRVADFVDFSHFSAGC